MYGIIGQMQAAEGKRDGLIEILLKGTQDIMDVFYYNNIAGEVLDDYN